MNNIMNSQLDKHEHSNRRSLNIMSSQPDKHERPHRWSVNNIMVVCVGNICRSPVAEALLKDHLPGRTIWSAGLHAVVGHGADTTALEIARQLDSLDLSAHRARQLAGWMCSRADLVLVMEAGHQQELERLYPLVRGKVHRLGEFGSQASFDIADPYRQPRAAFEAAHVAIALGVQEWVRRINLVSR